MWPLHPRKCKPQAHQKPRGTRLTLEALEERNLLSLVISDHFSSTSSIYADLTAGDFNGDGQADLIDIRGDNAAIVLDVRLGNGDGAFGSPLTSPTGFTKPLLSYPLHNLESGDFNSDGRLDVAALDTATSRLEVLFGKGDGLFHPSITVPLPPIGGEQQTGGSVFFETDSLAVGDLNEDGRLDIVAVADVSSTFTTYLNVLLGQGDGSFAAQAPVVLTGTYPTSSYAPAANISLGDYTGDGHLDVLSVSRIGTMWSTTTEVFLHPGRGDGTFDSVRIQTGYADYLVVDTIPADLNGDGNLDLVATAHNVYPALVGLGNGDGTFGPLQTVNGNGQIVDVAIADLNGDGALDLITADATANLDSLGIHLGNGDGTFQPVRAEAYGDFYYGVAAVDFNGDGRIDLATNTIAALNDDDWEGTPPPPALPTLTMHNVLRTEGNSGLVAASFTVTLSVASIDTVTVAYVTADGSARAGTDYQAASGTLTIPAGQTTGTIIVLASGDRVAESNETFFVNLSSPAGAMIADGQGVGTIVDDEPRISISDVIKAEGKKGQTTLFTFTVTLSDAYDQPVTVSHQTVNGTASSGSGDYVARTGTLTFAPGETTKAFTIEVKGDRKREANESFYVDLFDNSSNSLLAKNRGIGTILNDD